MLPEQTILLLIKATFFYFLNISEYLTATVGSVKRPETFATLIRKNSFTASISVVVRFSGAVTCGEDMLAKLILNLRRVAETYRPTPQV